MRNQNTSINIINILEDRLIGKSISLDFIEHKSRVKRIEAFPIENITPSQFKVVFQDDSFNVIDANTKISFLNCLPEDAPVRGCECKMCEFARVAGV